jgi:ArsR family transcriptional regulator, virulence genes transcriptional regulator
MTTLSKTPATRRPKTPSPATPTVSRLRMLSCLTRLRLLHLLRQGELTAGELVERLRLPQPVVSQHLGALRGAGLARSRRQGTRMHYRLADPSVEPLLDAIIAQMPLSERQQAFGGL